MAVPGVVKNGVVWKVTTGVLVSAVISILTTTMIARGGMPTNEEVESIVGNQIGIHGQNPHSNAVSYEQVAEAVGAVRKDVQALTLEVGKLIGRLDAQAK